jgi:signal transduction histidine kinase/DNA-binding response OmpR family regulator
VPPVAVGAEPHLAFSAGAEIFIDATGALGPEDVSARPGAFRPVVPADLAKSYDNRVFWLRATLHNRNPESVERWLVLDSPRLESATLFHRAGGVWTGIETGLVVPRSRKPVAAIGVVLPLKLAPTERRDVLLRVHSRTVIDLDATLWEPLAYSNAQAGRITITATAFGGSLIAALISLFVFARLRQRGYLYFAALHLSFAMMVLGREGLWERFLWPADLTLPIQAHVLMVSIAAVSLIFLQRNFLDIDKREPRWDRVFLALAAANVALFPASFVNYPACIRLASILVIIVAMLSLFVMLRAWWRGNQAALYLLQSYGLTWGLEGLRATAGLGLIKLPQLQDINASWALLLATPLILLALIEQARQLNEQLLASREMTRTKSEFLARVSHDLRTPLNTIIGYARMLGRGAAGLSVQQGTADIERSSLRLLDLIEDLLDQSQLDAGRLSLSVETLALHPWLAEIERAARLMAEAAGNNCVLVVDGPLPTAVLADGPRLRQILDNLLSNANRHTRQGQITLHCGVEPTAPEGRLQLSFAVIDNGEGIAPDDLERIFEPFQKGRTGHPSSDRRASRLGLGLSIAHDLSRLMGQGLTATSKLGVGTTFRFVIDCERVAGTGLAPAGATPSAERQFRRGEGLRVLIADDDPAALRSLQDRLEAQGLAAHGVRSGRALIAALADRREAWDLVITDQAMADGDGWSVLRFMREHHPTLPVVLMSAMAPQRPADLPADVDFDAFTSKPILETALVDTLCAMLPPLARQATAVTASQARPDAIRRGELAALVRAGRVTAIQQWSRLLAQQHPEFAAYAAEVEHQAHALDFEALEGLAGAAMLA